ncbi:integrase [Streptomyces xanthophaeus]
MDAGMAAVLGATVGALGTGGAAVVAALLARSQVKIQVQADQLGHGDPGFTLRTYTHLMPSSEGRTRKAVDGVYKASGSASDGPQTAQSR